MQRVITFLLSLLLLLPGTHATTANQHQSDAQVVISVTPTPPDIPASTDTPSIQDVSPTPTDQPTIDCTGPDGKHLQLSQDQCEQFNKAWGNYYPYLSGTPNPSTNTHTISCQVGDTWYQVTQSACASLQTMNDEQEIQKVYQIRAQEKAATEAYLQCERETAAANAFNATHPYLLNPGTIPDTCTMSN